MDNKKISQIFERCWLGYMAEKYICCQPHRWSLGTTIRSTRSILLSLMKTYSQSLNDESFHTLMAEVEVIMNSRPLTVETLNDVTSYHPLSLSD